MTINHTQFEQRKRDHIELALMPSNQSIELNFFDHVTLIHEALPDINFNDINIQSTRFGQKTSTPFVVSSMTAGHSGSVNVNRTLMEACAQSHWAMGVGSQRRELYDPNAGKEWLDLRLEFPDLTLFGNLGIAQIIDTPLALIQRLLDGLNPQALIIHCNPLQESIQPEGTTDFSGCWRALEQLTHHLTIPVIIKETGCGFSSRTLKRLKECGIAAVDVSGAGGTHWGRIEGRRTTENSQKQHCAHTFRNWGINTIQSVQNALSVSANYEIWGSGGVRNGLDAAKLFALGVTSVGFAQPMLEAALQSSQAVIDKMQTIEYELKTAMFCTGSLVLADLKESICL